MRFCVFEIEFIISETSTTGSRVCSSMNILTKSRKPKKKVKLKIFRQTITFRSVSMNLVRGPIHNNVICVQNDLLLKRIYDCDSSLYDTLQ